MNNQLNPATSMHEFVLHQTPNEEDILRLYEEAKAQFDFNGSNIDGLVKLALKAVVNQVLEAKFAESQGYLLHLVMLGFAIGKKSSPKANRSEQADAWLAVTNTLNEEVPGWSNGPANGMDCAVAAIRNLASQVRGIAHNAGMAKAKVLRVGEHESKT